MHRPLKDSRLEIILPVKWAKYKREPWIEDIFHENFVLRMTFQDRSILLYGKQSYFLFRQQWNDIIYSIEEQHFKNNARWGTIIGKTGINNYIKDKDGKKLDIWHMFTFSDGLIIEENLHVTTEHIENTRLEEFFSDPDCEMKKGTPTETPSEADGAYESECKRMRKG